jgi:cytochrome c553
MSLGGTLAEKIFKKTGKDNIEGLSMEEMVAMAKEIDPQAIVLLYPKTRSPQESSAQRPRIVIQVRGQQGPEYYGISKNEKGHTDLEGIVWNNQKGDYDFLLSGDGPHGKSSNAKQMCITCHQGGQPIFAVAPWSESNNNINSVIALIQGKVITDQKYQAEIAKKLEEIKEKMKKDCAAITPPVANCFNEFEFAQLKAHFLEGKFLDPDNLQLASKAALIGRQLGELPSSNYAGVPFIANNNAPRTIGVGGAAAAYGFDTEVRRGTYLKVGRDYCQSIENQIAEKFGEEGRVNLKKALLQLTLLNPKLPNFVEGLRNSSVFQMYMPPFGNFKTTAEQEAILKKNFPQGLDEILLKGKTEFPSNSLSNIDPFKKTKVMVKGKPMVVTGIVHRNENVVSQFDLESLAAKKAELASLAGQEMDSVKNFQRIKRLKSEIADLDEATRVSSIDEINDTVHRGAGVLGSVDGPNEALVPQLEGIVGKDKFDRAIYDSQNPNIIQSSASAPRPMIGKLPNLEVAYKFLIDLAPTCLGLTEKDLDFLQKQKNRDRALADAAVLKNLKGRDNLALRSSIRNAFASNPNDQQINDQCEGFNAEIIDPQAFRLTLVALKISDEVLRESLVSQGASEQKINAAIAFNRSCVSCHENKAPTLSDFTSLKNKGDEFAAKILERLSDEDSPMPPASYTRKLKDEAQKQELNTNTKYIKDFLERLP